MEPAASVPGADMRRTPRCLVLFAVLIGGLPAAAQGTFNKGWHEDARHGFKVKIPDKWDPVPVSVDEKWIVAKYIGDKPLIVKRGDYSGVDLKPQLRVIVFSDEARKPRDAEVKVEGKEGGVKITDAKDAEVPYKDYKDYIKRNERDGGFYVDKEKQATVAGAPCQQLEIKFEKLTIPRRVVTWVFRGDAADYAVEFEVLEDHWDKYGPMFLASLQSFRFVKRESSAVGTGGTTGSSRVEVGDSTDPDKRKAWKELSAKERTDRRKSTEESRMRRVKDSLPAGWTSRNTPHFLVVSHADQKYTDRVVEAAEACRNWLDKTLGPINDEYVMRGVIRICADFDEYRLFSMGSSDAWDSDSREIVTYKDARMGNRSGYDILFGGMLAEYIRDKDPLISRYAPLWVRVGLNGAIGAAAVEGKTLKLGPDEWEATLLREHQKSGAQSSARKLMEAPIDVFYQTPGSMVLAARLVRHFLSRKKDFVLDYLKAVSEVGEEASKSDTKASKEAETEVEEEARMKESREAAKKRSAEIVQKINAKACAWSDKEWQSLESAFAATLK
jgi:hypothetical protein